jgi:pilus assembly protein TadC
MIVTKLTLLSLAAFTWYGGGIALFLKAGALIKEAYTLNPVSFWIYLAPILGITIGLIKTLLIFNHACKKNIKRIQSLTTPKLWQFFRPGMFIFLAIIIPAGASMSRMAAGKFGWLCAVAVLDLSIGTALLASSLQFWKKGAFKPAEASISNQ